MSCDGWEISTVEHLGNTTDGLHPIQVRRHTPPRCSSLNLNFSNAWWTIMGHNAASAVQASS